MKGASPQTPLILHVDITAACVVLQRLQAIQFYVKLPKYNWGKNCALNPLTVYPYGFIKPHDNFHKNREHKYIEQFLEGFSRQQSATGHEKS